MKCKIKTVCFDVLLHMYTHDPITVVESYPSVWIHQFGTCKFFCTLVKSLIPVPFR